MRSTYTSEVPSVPLPGWQGLVNETLFAIGTLGLLVTGAALFTLLLLGLMRD